MTISPNGGNEDFRPTDESIILYVDESPESHEARSLLEDSGARIFLTNGPVGLLEQKPLALFRGGFYEGSEEIQGLLGLLSFWARRPNSESQGRSAS